MESPQTLEHARRPPARDGWAEAAGPDGLVLGRYRLLERLGAGGFGVVWSAHDELLHREVAVKRIPLAPGEDAERASREALASARLAHPAIVALYEACAVEDAFYLISELIDGQTLARLIAEDALSNEQVLRIGVALCSALAHAHSRGVVHRDVKPQNVLVPRSGDPDAPSGQTEALGGVAKLTDFGGARMSEQDVLTQTGDVLGTLAYMAPEQSEGREVGEQSDLYSLALVTYEALCGVNPVRGSTPAQTVRLVGRTVPSLSRARKDLPRALTIAIDRALSTSPARRGTLQELRLALEEALQQIATTTRRERRSRRIQPTLAQPQIQPRPRRRKVAQNDLALPLPDEFVSGTPAGGELEPHSPPRSAPVLPRALWLAGTVAAGVWQALAGRPGVSLLLLAAVLPIVLAPVGRRSRSRSGGWLVAALAPALGMVGLAGAFPAIAGQAARWRMRAALGALGYWWLTLGEPLLSRRLWLGVHSGTPARTVWEGSLQSAATHTIAPLLSVPVLLGATLWAAGAAVLPLLVRGRSAPLDVIAATVWSAVLAAAAPLVDSGLSAHTALAAPRGAILGALFGGALAVGARALRGPV